MNSDALLWGLLFGSIGIGYFVYGRRQKLLLPFLVGIALMVFPYFIDSTAALIGVGVALMAVPFVLKI